MTTTLKTRTLSVSPDAIRKRIKRANAQFEAQSPAEKRVTVAKDVLLWLNSRKLVARTGMYFGSGTVEDLSSSAYQELVYRNGDRVEGGYEKYREYLDSTDLQEVIFAKGDDFTCRACALGGMFACAVARQDKITLGQASSPTRTTLVEYLGGLFEQSQLDMIESAFEGSAFGSCRVDEDHEDEPTPEGQRAIDFGLPYQDYNDDGDYIGGGSEARMRAIMENIIANKGEFRP